MEKMAFLNSSSAIGSVADIWSSMRGWDGAKLKGEPTACKLRCDVKLRQPHPHGRVVEGGAAIGRHGIVANQRVDGPLLLKGASRPDTLDDERRLVLAGIERGLQNHRAAAVADAHAPTRPDAQLGSPIRVHSQDPSPLPGARGPRLREGRIAGGPR